uniref:Small lysine rich protein 1 n=1 Tax=Hippocampus comes TaxID=109280 RepID=A0A3Q2YXG9_HIPCM
KSRSHNSGLAKKTELPKAGTKSSTRDKSTQKNANFLSAAAMENVYYVAHNAAACLELRGYGWSKDKRKKTKKRKQFK